MDHRKSLMGVVKKKQSLTLWGIGLLLLCAGAMVALSFSSAFSNTWLMQATVQNSWCHCERYVNLTRAYLSELSSASTPAAVASCSKGAGISCNASASAAPPPAIPSPAIIYVPSPVPVSSPCPVASKPSPAPVHHAGDNAFFVNMTDLDHMGMEGDKACQTESSRGLKLDTDDINLISPVVVVGHNRVNYLARCLMALLRHWKADPKNEQRFPLFVSIDGGDPQALSFSTALRESTGLQVITRTHDPVKCNESECHISLHYQMLLQVFFKCLDSPRLIFLEEDLEIAPDFFSYFANTYQLLAQDKTLQCISCWNDQAQRGRALNNTALYRTEIFPGLGWMLDKERAMEWVNIWPSIAWDDWMRVPGIRKGRSCLFPEMPRVLHYGRWGTHTTGPAGQWFYNTFLANIVASSEYVDWSKQDISYVTRPNYDRTMEQWLLGAKRFNYTGLNELREYCDSNKPMHTDLSDMYVGYQWNDTHHGGYHQVVDNLPGMITDIRGGKPRSSYNGTVMVRCRGRRLFLRSVPII